MRSVTATTLLATLLMCCAATSHAREPVWLSSVSASLGQSDDSDESRVYRIGMQKDWRHSWFNQGAWYLGGYWDTEIGMMKPENGTRNKVYDFGLTPVFRFQRDAHLSSGVIPFAEAGIGAHLLSDTHLGDRSLSTAFQFGSLIGLGVGFGERGQYELSYRYTHISNADLKQPNDGVDLHLLKLGYNFN
jgi:lipid A 3-O-deacylase